MEPKTLSLADLEAFDSRARAGGRERRFCCPFCGNEKPMDAAHRSLCVNVESGVWNCKRCEAKGLLKEFQRDTETPAFEGKRRRIEQAQRMLEGSAPRELQPSPESVAGFKRQIREVKPLKGSAAEEYLASRGISPELAHSARCRYCESWGKIGAAVVFPICDESGAAVAAAGRAIRGSGKQTFGPKSLGVFSTPGALDADPVAVTEAPIDALTLAFAGLPAIALCGTSGLPGWLVTSLAKPVKPGKSRLVYLAFDNDGAGESASAKIGNMLSLVRTARLRPRGSKDWNAMLCEQGLCSILSIPEIIQLNPDYSSPDSPRCRVCGKPVKLHSYPDNEDLSWYECENCDYCGTVSN